MESVRFEVLGTPRVTVAGTELAIGGRRQRVVLALLLAQPNRSVSVDALIDATWSGEPPGTAREQIQTAVWKLRRVLGAERVVSAGAGYRLRVETGELDAEEFAALVESATTKTDASERAAMLDVALGMWRSETAYDGLVDVEPLFAGSRRLDERRLHAFQERIRADLDCGRAEQVVDEIEAVANEHPLREQLIELWMRALYQAGRRADALTAYAVARDRLADATGLDPGPALQELQAAILADDPRLAETRPGPMVIVPAQLPPATADFVGRTETMAALDRLLLDARRVAAPVAVVSGPPGVGKTTLAVQWGHLHRDRFPDGQLVVNLRGFDRALPAEPLEALASFLRALGTPEEQIPPDTEDAAARYRSLLADRALLVVLDNAASADQVRPLLPGSANCATLITSRETLTGLVAHHGARVVGVDMLDADESEELLERMLGANRVAAEPEGAEMLAVECDHLPLALRIAAANLAVNPHDLIADHAARLGEEGLDALSVDADNPGAVAAAFSQSYAALDAPAQRMFRILGLFPGPDFTSYAVGALADLAPKAARRLLDRLAAAHMIRPVTSDRFAFHDLLHRYAGRLADSEESAGEREAARRRLLDWYGHSMRAVAEHLSPSAVLLPLPTQGDLPVPFNDAARADRWVQDEVANVTATARLAADMGDARTAVALPTTLATRYWLARHAPEWLTMVEIADRASEHSEDRWARAALLRVQGIYQLLDGDQRLAPELFAKSLDLVRLSGWTDLEPIALSSLGGAQAKVGDYSAAMETFRMAVQRGRTTENGHGLFLALHNLSLVEGWLGELGNAVEHAREAVPLARTSNRPNSKPTGEELLAELLVMRGEYAEAAQLVDDAIAGFREAGDIFGEVMTLNTRARLLLGRGCHNEARNLSASNLALARTGEFADLQTTILATLGRAHLEVGDLPEARTSFELAATMASESGGLLHELEAALGLASVAVLAGQPTAARDRALNVLQRARRHGLRRHETNALVVISQSLLADGDRADVLRSARSAYHLMQQTGDRTHLAAVHAVLAELGYIVPA
ncbi:AfsR/SARP family transcriptional regulator [Nocardioides speluncae]|uniref:AfsR/SARP family transcriptional regulator n=1 Tax=Nocardioides speluncae TaxID=2670337 RepID=UPI0013799FA7|nr:BTAD domain-containing putative transcriptional regulator [Nocardioides speluncae]